MESCNSDGQILSDSDNKKQFLSDISSQDKPWDTHKAFCDNVSKVLKGSEKEAHQKQAKRIDECSQNLEFGYVLVSSETGDLKLRLKHAWFCRVRHCPICQWRRALMWVARFFDAFPRIYAAYPEMRYIMLTLTVKNCSISDLRATVTQMNTAWKRLSQRKDFPALGFVRSLEVTRGKDGSAHPHFHILLAVPPSYFSGGSRGSYLSKDKWAALWQDAMRLDYKPVCDVRIVKEKKLKKEKLVEGLPLSEFETESTTPEPMKALMSAITETIKYTTKPADMVKEKAWLLEMVDQMANVRAVALGGIFKQFLKETETEQDLIAPSETDIAEAKINAGGVHFTFVGKIKRYKRFYPVVREERASEEKPEVIETQRAELSRLAQQAVVKLNDFEAKVASADNPEAFAAELAELREQAVKALKLSIGYDSPS